MRIALATHAHSIVDFRAHFNHMHALAAWSKKYEIIILGLQGLQAAEARNFMVDEAIKSECSSIFFLDADHLVPLETLDYLMESFNDAMVSGVVVKRGYPFEQVCFLKTSKEKGGPQNYYIDAEVPVDGQIWEVGVCAFGCTLINLSKIKLLKKPYFRDTCEASANGDLINIRSDVNLCNAFREIGEKVFIDTRVVVGHLWNGMAVYPTTAKITREYVEARMKSLEVTEKEAKVKIYRSTL